MIGIDGQTENELLVSTTGQHYRDMSNTGHISDFALAGPHTPRYVIVQYMADPMRCEMRNIGIVLWTPRGIGARFFAERIDDAGMQHFDRDKIPDFIEVKSGYMQWVSTWRSLISNVNIAPLRGGKPVSVESPDFITTLSTFCSEKYLIIHGGMVFDDVSTDLVESTDYLFDMLVSNRSPMDVDEYAGKGRIDRVCARLLKTTGLRRTNFIKQNEIVGKESVFDIVVESPQFPKYVYQSVPVNGSTAMQNRYANSAIFQFEDAVTNAKVEPDNAFALIYATSDALQRPSISRTVERLRSKGIPLVNLFSEEDRLISQWERIANPNPSLSLLSSTP